MLAASASLLNVNVIILDDGEHGPAKRIVAPSAPHLSHVDGSFANPEKIRELANRVDVLTIEIEHVNTVTLQEVQSAFQHKDFAVHPHPSTVEVIQDKYRQKVHLSSHGLPISDFVPVESSVESISDVAGKLGLPLMLKSRTLAYDGRGNFVLRELGQAQEAITALNNRPLYAEKWVPFKQEIAVMVVRSVDGQVQSYPVVETIHKDNICHLVFAPLRSRDASLSQRARTIAEAAVKSFSGAGVFGVEMFLMENGT